MNIEWENYRRADGSIDLYSASKPYFEDNLMRVKSVYAWNSLEPFVKAFFNEVESLSKIKSRQAAAIALTTCYFMCINRMSIDGDTF